MDTRPAQPIRVLIVDDNLDTQENLAKMLAFERDIQVVGTAASGRAGIERAIALQPQVILMDINMPDMDGIQATEAIRARVPAAQIIIMSIQGEHDYLRRAMIAGAADYLIKPFSGDELATSIRTVHQRAAAVAAEPPTAPATRATGRLIVFFSPKGGVGRTTLAVNTAVALRHEIGKKVALFDASLLFGDVGVMLNATSPYSIVDLVNHADGIDAEIAEGVLATHLSGVKVLLAPPRPELAELVTPAHLSAILAFLRAHFDFVIVDTAPSLQETTLTILDQADQIVVITTLEMPALKNLKLYLETAEALGYPPGKHVLVVNRADSSGGIRVQDVEAHVRQKVAALIVNDWKTATLASNRGIPFVLANRDSPLAKNVIELARALSGQPDPVRPARGLFRR